MDYRDTQELYEKRNLNKEQQDTYGASGGMPSYDADMSHFRRMGVRAKKPSKNFIIGISISTVMLLISWILLKIT